VIFLEEIPTPYFERQGVRTRTIMIGIDDYQDTNITKLKGAENDVLHLATKLQTFGGFKIDQSEMESSSCT
jgi:hypothetical protein